MSMQVIWKIKHQNLNFQGKRIYAHKSYYQLMGFVWIPSDLFKKFTPCCLDEYIMWTKPYYTASPTVGVIPNLSFDPSMISTGNDAGNHISMWLTVKMTSVFYLFSETCFKYFYRLLPFFTLLFSILLLPPPFSVLPFLLSTPPPPCLLLLILLLILLIL